MTRLLRSFTRLNVLCLDYVTAEIKGDDEEKRRILKKGALIAVAVVSSLYILLNIVLVSFKTVVPSLLGHIYLWKFKLIQLKLLVLSLDEILHQQQFTIVYNLVLQVSRSNSNITQDN